MGFILKAVTGSYLIVFFGVLIVNGHSIWVSSRLTAAVDCRGSAEPIHFLNCGG